MSELTKLKKTFKKHYVAYHELCDDYSCGKTLAEHLSLTIASHKIEANKALKRLKEIDPEAKHLPNTI